GGIRLVKTYTAERRERQVFGKGVHKLFRNVAATITAISWVSAVTTVIIGIVGMLLIAMGGRAILSGQMTLGDFIMYVFFIGLVAAPLVQIYGHLGAPALGVAGSAISTTIGRWALPF